MRRRLTLVLLRAVLSLLVAGLGVAAAGAAGAGAATHGYDGTGFSYDSSNDAATGRVGEPAGASMIRSGGAGVINLVSERSTPSLGRARQLVAPSGLLDNFADVGSGASLTRRVDVDGVPVSIKSGHGYRPDHGSVDITGVLGRDAVDSAVVTDLATRVNAGTSLTRAGSGHSTFQTVVGGHTVEYRAVFVPATGRYEVGTYYIP